LIFLDFFLAHLVSYQRRITCRNEITTEYHLASTFRLCIKPRKSYNYNLILKIGLMYLVNEEPNRRYSLLFVCHILVLMLMPPR